MLDQLTKDFAAAVVSIDARKPVARNKRSGEAFGAGLGPHSEAETFDLVIHEAKRASPQTYLAIESSVQRCDMKLVTPTTSIYAEGKLLRLRGDNGKPNDNMLMHILSPYQQHRSALTDCLKLSKSGFEGTKAIIIIGYSYPDMPLEPAITAFEKLANGTVGARSEAGFEGLCHPIHKSEKVIAWPIS